MTIVEIKNQVLTHFFNNTIFSLSSDSQKIELDDDLKPLTEEVVRTVLVDLENLGLIKKVASAQKEIWILTQSLTAFNQNVTITAATAEMISDTINSFREANEISGDISDKTKITEADIINLVNISHIMAETPLDDEESEDDNEEGDDGK